MNMHILKICYPTIMNSEFYLHVRNLCATLPNLVDIMLSQKQGKPTVVIVTLISIAVKVLVVGIPILVGYLRMDFATGIYKEEVKR